MKNDPVFRRFVQLRQELNTQLADRAAEVDEWLARKYETSPTFADLALLEGLLLERRNLLSELAALDDDFMNHLLRLRQQIVGASRPKTSPATAAEVSFLNARRGRAQLRPF